MKYHSTFIQQSEDALSIKAASTSLHAVRMPNTHNVKKTLNKTNLEALGADRLAALLIEVSTGSADIKRRLRLELSHNLGVSEPAQEVRKRLTSLRKANRYVGWRKRKALIKDLDTPAAMIVDKIAADNPMIAFDLLWQFIEIAPSIYERVDDSNGDVGDVFRAALNLRISRQPRSLIHKRWQIGFGPHYKTTDMANGMVSSHRWPPPLARTASHA